MFPSTLPISWVRPYVFDVRNFARRVLAATLEYKGVLGAFEACPVLAWAVRDEESRTNVEGVTSTTSLLSDSTTS